MPFIGKDWRSPGEAWVKTDEGSWEKLKILETCMRSGHSDLEEGSCSPTNCNEIEMVNENNCDKENTRLTSAPQTIPWSGSKSSRLQENNQLSSSCDDTTSMSMSLNHSQGSCFFSPPSSPCSWPPHCQITLKSTKEVAGYNTISEAFYRLDFTSAISDIRRFNYVTKLLHLLINQSLTTLSGCATKVLFSMLEQLAWQGMFHINLVKVLVKQVE